ncbi:MAG: homocitrate synthase [Chloroflexi bacterium]|uniref:homocitrate synthase n=1 Tax=Candidatus Flexifilum breve TaxID=3140694 RepID=UPI00313568BB|nr:homocitrate synthase [Chloroflexota bacterium]
MSFEQFSVIESTLREGEQFSTATFSTDEKLEIVRLLNEFGAEMIELTSPLASPQSEADVRAITRMVRSERMQTRILTHIRCKREDAMRALDTGVHGVDVVIGTSPQLMQHSHGKSIRQVIDAAGEVLSYIREQAPDVVLRFSTEDSFRSRPADLYRVYLAVADLGLVNRLGVADTVGVALPSQVSALVGQLVKLTGLDIEFHGHNDSGCAIANACAALEAGATHIDTTILGIGERNGITPLGGLVARLYTIKKSYVAKYNLKLLPRLDQLIADICDIDIPFNNYITGSSAFIHKAGIHAKAVLADPESYESINPDDFGITRGISIGHRLTGWNAIRNRANQLGLTLEDTTVQQVTQTIKARADVQPLSLPEVDDLLIAAANGVF